MQCDELIGYLQVVFITMRPVHVDNCTDTTNILYNFSRWVINITFIFMRWEISFFFVCKHFNFFSKVGHFNILIYINLDSSGNEKTAVNCTWFSFLSLFCQIIYSFWLSLWVYTSITRLFFKNSNTTAKLHLQMHLIVSWYYRLYMKCEASA